MFSHLIVDGYNIINKWPHLKKAKDKSLDYARQQLIDIMKMYSDYTGIKVTIVFDGTDKSNLKINKEKNNNFNILFSKKSETADSIIERLVYNTNDKNGLIVATDDHCQQNMIFGMGGFYITSFELAKRVGVVTKQLKRNLTEIFKKKKPISKISI